MMQDAGVSIEAFLTHFHDKDALKNVNVGGELDKILQISETKPTPIDPETLEEYLMLLVEYMTRE
ncbi:MAG: hypothetical protein ABJO67_15720 [Pseudoruegeria sp.]